MQGIVVVGHGRLDGGLATEQHGVHREGRELEGSGAHERGAASARHRALEAQTHGRAPQERRGLVEELGQRDGALGGGIGREAAVLEGRARGEGLSEDRLGLGEELLLNGTLYLAFI